MPRRVPSRSPRGPLGGLSRRWRRFSGQVRMLSGVVRRLSPYISDRKGSVLVVLLAALGHMILRLLEPWPLKLVFDHVLLGVELPARLAFLEEWVGDGGPLLTALIGAIIVIALLSGFLFYWQSILCSHLGQKVVAGLRVDLFRHLHRLDATFHDRRRTGDVLVRLMADIRLLRDALVKLPIDIAQNALFMVGMAVVLLVMDWQLALLSFCVLPLLFLLVRRYRLPMKDAIRKQRRREGDLATVASESLGAIRVIQGLGSDEHPVRRFAGMNRRTLKQGLKAARIEAKLRWGSDLSVSVITALVVGVAARRIMVGALSPGDLIVFIAYLRAFARPLRRVSRTTEQVTRTTTAGERVLEILDLVPGVRDLPDAVEAPPLRGEIRFESVGLRHGRHPWSLRGIDFTLRAGERLGIVGPTGAGKSSIVNLVPRFYDATEGSVLLDGHDVRSFTLASLRQQIGFVFQEPVLFATTVAENIAVSRPGASREEIEEAALKAGIHEVITNLAEGYDTVVGERGGTLSGGQRQCVAIARAILRDAPVVILDEPTTGLDQRAATLVIEALRKLMEGRTVLMISHELHRLRDADRIIVLERGRLVQEGTYQELCERQGLFSELIAYGRVT